MPLHLPGGWVDTGIRMSFTMGGSAQMILALSPHKAGVSRIILDEWDMQDTSGILADPDACAPGNYKDVLQATVTGPFIGGSPVGGILESHTVDPCYSLLSTSIEDHQQRLTSENYAFARTEGPYRLGQAYVLARTGLPDHCDKYDVRYQWFCDGYTSLDSSFGPYTAPTRWRQTGGGWGTTQDTGAIPQAVGQELGFYQFYMFACGLDHVAGGFGVTDHIPCCWIRNMNISGDSLPCSEFADPTGAITGDDSGNVTGYSDQVDQGGSAMAPYHLEFSADVTKNGEGSTGAHLLDNLLTVTQLGSDGLPRQPHLAYLTCPFHAGPYTLWRTSWARHGPNTREISAGPDGSGADMRYYVDATWSAAYPKGAWDALDLNLLINAAPTRMNPAGAAGETIPYYPCQGKFRSVVSVHKPDGSKRSFWTAPGGGMTIDESGSDTIFTVTDETQYAERIFVTSWRNWVGLGAGGKTNPDFGIQRYEITKRDYLAAGGGDDTWGWQHHGNLRSNWSTAPLVLTDPAPSGSLLLHTIGNLLEVGDGHQNEPTTRIAALTTTLHPYDRVYAIELPALGGPGDVFTRLLFPQGSVPFAQGRVDSLRLFFPGPGIYTLHSMDLVVRHPIYFKQDYDGPVPRRNYSANMEDLDGAHSEGEWPDMLYKPEETGDWGGGQRFIDPIINILAPEASILDRNRLMTDWIDNYNQKEGMDFTYLAPNANAAIQDPEGNRLFPELAQWIWPLVPHTSMDPGVAFEPPASPRGRILRVTNLQRYLVRANHPLAHGAIEAQVVIDNAPAPAGVICTALRAGVAEATASTDLDGFVVLSPCFANADPAKPYTMSVTPP